MNMKIKNILAVLSLGMVSCVGLEQYPTNSYTDETFWTIEDNVRSALYLAYNQCWHQDYYYANNLLSDDVYGSRHSTNETAIATGMANPSNGRFSDEWNKCYQELRTIHTALEAEDRMNVDEAFKTRMLAELRLMRAFTYLRLVTWFGDVPFFTVNPTLPEARNVKPTPAATIKAFIHSELEEVAEILPKNTEIPSDENGRYTRGTAVALNARAYLYDNDFENCAKWCDKLINSTDYGTYGLESDYAKLFHDQECSYGPEVLMTIEFATLGGIDNIVKSWNNFNAVIPQTIGNKGVTTQSPTQELVDTYRKLDGTLPTSDTDYANRDKRFAATIAYNGSDVEIPTAKALGLVGSEGTDKGTYKCYTYSKDEKEIGDSKRVDSYNGTQDRTATGYYTLKNYNGKLVASNGNTYKSLIEIRYADVLLMYAESMNELNQMSADVWDKTIKPLRERAGFNADYCAYPGGSNLRQVIRDERRVELALEGRRAFDLRRWALLENPSLKTTGAVYITHRATGAPFLDNNSNIQCQNSYNMKYWFAIPQKERDINPNLPQNPGW